MILSALCEDPVTHYDRGITSSSEPQSLQFSRLGLDQLEGNSRGLKFATNIQRPPATHATNLSKLAWFKSISPINNSGQMSCQKEKAFGFEIKLQIEQEDQHGLE